MSQIRENKQAKFSHPILPSSHCNSKRQSSLPSIADFQGRKALSKQVLSVKTKEKQVSSAIIDQTKSKLLIGSSQSSLLRMQSPLRRKSYLAVSKRSLRLEITKSPPRNLSKVRIISAHAQKNKKYHPNQLKPFFILPQSQLHFRDPKELPHPQNLVLKRQKEVISQYYDITTKNQEEFTQLQSCVISEQVRIRKEGKVRIPKNNKQGKESKKSKPKLVQSAVCKLVPILKENNPDGSRKLLPAFFVTFGKSA